MLAYHREEPRGGEQRSYSRQISKSWWGATFTAAQRANLIAKRKAAYEAVHPETKQGGRPGKAGGGKAKAANLASFVAETTGKTASPGTSLDIHLRSPCRKPAEACHEKGDCRQTKNARSQ